MTDINPPKSILEQIFDEMFAEIETLEIFDAETIKKLKNLAAKDNLHKAAQVEKTLKSTPGSHQ